MTARPGSIPALVAGASLLLACTAPLNPRGEFSVHVKSVRIDPRTESPVVLLEEVGGAQRALPIWIGVFEAQSIALALESVPVPRPNTHDLIKNIIAELPWKLERVVITELRDGTYYAVMVVQVNGRSIEIDSRPSDAIAVAVRTRTPVFATDEVLNARDADGAADGPKIDIGLPPAPGDDPPPVELRTH
jgi:bifunctional DNase/RNase